MMAKSDKHSESSAKRFGGKMSDYIEIHEFIDSSKAYLADNRHRTLFHSTAGIYYCQKMFGIDFDALKMLRLKYDLPETFIHDFLELTRLNRNQGVHILNSDNKKVHVRDIAEQHILEDFRFRFIPTPKDYLQNMKLLPWMDNGLTSIETTETKPVFEGVKKIK
jgi:hypothetical protein